MTDLIRRSDAHRIALHYSGDVAAQKIMELPAVNAIPISAIEAKQEEAWIPVEERLPDHSDPVIVSVPETDAFAAYIGMAYYIASARGGFWCGTDGNVYGAIGIITNPTHWQPLPEQPGGEANG